jgi:hypothetical protein
MAKRIDRESEAETAGVTAALDRLFTAPPRDFVAVRAKLVSALRSEGDAQGAKTVAAARRPPPSAWALNVVAREHADTMKQYVVAAARLRAAQRETLRRENAGPFAAARHAIAEHEASVLALAKAAITDGGLPWTPDARRRVAQTLHAVALAGDDDRARLLAGRLEADIDAPSDFEALAVSLGDVASAPRKKEASQPAAAEHGGRGETHDRDARHREERAAEARRAREREEQAEAERKAREALARAKAEANATELEAVARERAENARALRHEAAKAEHAAAKARSAAELAAKEAAEAREKAAAARAAIQRG